MRRRVPSLYGLAVAEVSVHLVSARDIESLGFHPGNIGIGRDLDAALGLWRKNNCGSEGAAILRRIMFGSVMAIRVTEVEKDAFINAVRADTRRAIASRF
jgi:hypothetical protein